MFEVGWTEMLVIAIVMIVVVGPKDLPNMLRTAGRMAAKLRGMAGDFQKQFNDALKEAELDDVKKSVDSLRSLNPMNEIRKQLNPFEQAAADVRSGLETAMKPKPAEPPDPASSEPQAAEPLKNGATEMPGVGPETMPATPVFPAATESPAAVQTASVGPAKPGRAVKAAPSRKATGSAAAKAAKTASPKAVKAAPSAKEKSASSAAKAKASSSLGAAPNATVKPAKAATAKPAAQAVATKPATKSNSAAKAVAAKPASAAKTAAGSKDKKTARPAK